MDDVSSHSVIFDIDLNAMASQKDHDGHFNATSPLAGRSVNVKWGLRQEGGLDLVSTAIVDDPLVLAGPRASTAPSASTNQPWVIASVFLFDAREIVQTLQSAKVGVGTFSRVRKHLWDAAMIYPKACNPRLVATEAQRTLLSLFARTPQSMTL